MMNISQGDLYKPLDLTLTLDGAVFALNGSDVLSLSWSAPDGTLITVVPTVVSLPAGTVRYDFLAGQTDAVGFYKGKLTVTRGGLPISFPDDGTRFIWAVNP